MKMFDVQIALEGVAEARREWAKAQTKFNSDINAIMSRLLHEAARNHMSVERVARLSGMTPRRIRTLMKAAGLDPNLGKRLLAEKASDALLSNAALLGIEPHEMDLTSPLAYLPAGSNLRKQFLETPAMQGVKELPEEGLETFVCPLPGCNCDEEFRAEAAQS